MFSALLQIFLYTFLVVELLALKKIKFVLFFDVNVCMCVQYMSVCHFHIHAYSCRSQKNIGGALGFWLGWLLRAGFTGSCDHAKVFNVGDGIQTQVFLTLPTELSPSFSSSGYQKRVITSYSPLWPRKCFFSCILPTLPPTKGLSFF